MTKHLLLASLALTAVLACVQRAEAAPILAMTPVWGGAAAMTTTDQSMASEPVIGAEELETLSGEGLGAITVLTGQTLTAITAGNTITAGTVGSGAITLDQNAFSGFDGIGNFVINSGHNNTLQSSLSVSIVLAP